MYLNVFVCDEFCTNETEMKQFFYFFIFFNNETNLFPQDMIQDIYKLHWNIIHKSTGVT